MKMPGKKKKKFIEKKNAVTFRLVHRSQKDPLQADEDAPQRVLLPASGDEPQKRKEEQKKYGVFYEDDYDYMQHLKDVEELYEVEPDDHFRIATDVPAPVVPDVSLEQIGPETRIQLPSTVFGSGVETEVGLLNKAAPLKGPQLDWDPDIVAGLDEDFDFNDPENILEDDFIIQANPTSLNTGSGSDVEPDDGEDEDEVASDEGGNRSDVASDVGSFGDQSFEELETKSRFTSYSMSSSAIHRNEGLTLLDSRFEKIYEQYDDEEIGALDQDDIAGYVNQGNELLNAAVEEYEKKQKENEKKLEDGVEPAAEELDLASEDSDDDVLVRIEEPAKEKWDCESILSTYSTLYNHPKTIEEPKKVKPIKLTKRAGIPADVLSQRGLTRQQLEEMNKASTKEHVQPVTYRPHDETSEEKKLRKQAIKEDRRARREEKKANKLAFKAEKIRQDKEVINFQKNLQGIKMD